MHFVASLLADTARNPDQTSVRIWDKAGLQAAKGYLEQQDDVLQE